MTGYQTKKIFSMNIYKRYKTIYRDLREKAWIHYQHLCDTFV